MTTANDFVTHTVENQPTPLVFDAWASDRALQEAVQREGGGFAVADLARFGPVVGGEMQALAFEANENRPKLDLFDRYGRRLDAVKFHPAYHRLMSLGIEHGVTGYAWRHAATAGAHVARMALCYMHNQADQGTGCPMTMTYACVPTLRRHPKLFEALFAKVSAPVYDSRPLPAWQKDGVTFGMGMTEKQGGSDVRSNSTRAASVGEDELGARYELVGHKWFFSAPMSDAFFVLAQAPGGLSCFFVPRFLPDGSKNAVRIQRLKDKLGDWSNASSEVEFTGASAWRVGDEGRGVATILEMVALTRLDCMIGTSGTMRAALLLALHHTRHRSAFGKRLSEQPLMQNVLADMALEWEGHLALTARVARAIDRSAHDPHEAAFARVATAIGKFWVCKRGPVLINEAQECHGGIGYVEESPIARLYRQAPLNSIWEGSGNVQCLDVLRAVRREPAALEAVFVELSAATGGHRLLDREIEALRAECSDVATLELRARAITERLAIALQASLLVRAGNTDVADAFCASRIGAATRTLGTLGAEVPFAALLERVHPEA